MKSVHHGHHRTVLVDCWRETCRRVGQKGQNISNMFKLFEYVSGAWVLHEVGGRTRLL